MLITVVMLALTSLVHSVSMLLRRDSRGWSLTANN